MDEPTDPDRFPDLSPVPFIEGTGSNGSIAAISDGGGDHDDGDHDDGAAAGDSSSQYTDASDSDFEDDDGPHSDGRSAHSNEKDHPESEKDGIHHTSFPRRNQSATGFPISSSSSTTHLAHLNNHSSGNQGYSHHHERQAQSTSSFPSFPPTSPPSSSFHHGNNSSSSNSHNHHHSQNEALLPPFYNRPPTPVPPSPSFTNLILPTTSTAPATPYASDDDVAAPISPTSPKVPTYEYYGFVLYLFSSLAFLVYLLWSFLPSPFLHALGIFYYPNRWWSLAIPSFLVMTIVYIYVALVSYNVEVLTPPLHAIETIVDDAAKVAVVDGRGRLVHGKAGAGAGGGGGGGGRRPGTSHGMGTGSGGGGGTGGAGGWIHGNDAVGGRMQQQDTGLEAWCVGTDAVLDIPLAGVCEMLYCGQDWNVRNGENGRYTS